VEKPDFQSDRGEAEGEIASCCRLADTAFAGSHGDDMLHAWNSCGLCCRSCFGMGMGNGQAGLLVCAKTQFIAIQTDHSSWLLALASSHRSTSQGGAVARHADRNSH